MGRTERKRRKGKKRQQKKSNPTADPRQSCAKTILTAGPKAAEIVCELATGGKKEWALKYVLGAIGLEEAVEQAVAEQSEKKQQDAFISTAFERRLIEDLRRAGRSDGGEDVGTIEN